MDSGFRIRVDSALRAAFVRACKARDVPAAQVLRSFMRDFVERASAEAAQNTLFQTPPTKTRRQASRPAKESGGT